MGKPVHVIGLESKELPAVTAVVSLLRHPDPIVGELCRQALAYLQDLATKRSSDPGAHHPPADSIPSAG